MLKNLYWYRVIFFSFLLPTIFFNRIASGGFGVHGGLNLTSSNIEGGNAFNASTKADTKILLGAFYESAGHILKTQLELNYVEKQLANFLAIPFFAKARFGLPNISTFLLLGVAPALKINGPEAINSFDVSVDFGGGLEFALLPSVGLLVEGRYSIGLIDLLPSSPISKITSRGLQLLLGIHFQF